MINYPPSISTVKHILLSTILKRGQCKPSFMKKFYWNFLKPFVCHLRILRAINISYTQYKLIPSSRSWLPIQSFGKSKPIKMIRYESKISLLLAFWAFWKLCYASSSVAVSKVGKHVSIPWLLMMAIWAWTSCIKFKKFNSNSVHGIELSSQLKLSSFDKNWT